MSHFMNMFALADMEQIGNGIEDIMNFRCKKQHGVSMSWESYSIHRGYYARTNQKYFLTYFLTSLTLFSFMLHRSFQGEAATRMPMPPAGSQMCGRMTCWPDGLPAVNQEAPFPLTSFFPTEPTPVPTSRLHGENHIQRRESSGGNDQHISAINNSDANYPFYTEQWKIQKLSRRKR